MISEPKSKKQSILVLFWIVSEFKEFYSQTVDDLGFTEYSCFPED